jgi:hypothetical protein
MQIHSFTVSYTFKNMKCDLWVSFLSHTFASPYFGREPKARVAKPSALCLKFTCLNVFNF